MPNSRGVNMATGTYKKPRPFVGLLNRRGPLKTVREAFWSSTRPTKETHGHRYRELYGPFRTLLGVRWCTDHGPTQLARTVDEMERAAREGGPHATPGSQV